MSTLRLSVALCVGLALFTIMSTMVAAAPASGSRKWLATGTVTKVDGSTVYLLGRDNRIYTIDSSCAQLLSDLAVESRPVQQGDKIRVYGSLDGDGHVTALRIRLIESGSGASQEAEAPKKEIKIIYERPQPEAANGAGPVPVPECQVQPTAETCPWDGRGLISDIDYTGRRIKLRTPNGQYTVNIEGSLMVQGGRRIGLGRFSLGDAVRVSGSLVCDYEINATRVSLLRTKIEAENALPQLPVALGGVIQQVDYPSMTFTMWTETTPVTVMADQDTVIQHQQVKQSFTDLRPGMRIKMNGNGSLGTGYAAREILIIGVAP